LLPSGEYKISTNIEKETKKKHAKISSDQQQYLPHKNDPKTK
jgi:hypothetical protein